jgi:AmiR/NasT family two-component response regulator
VTDDALQEENAHLRAALLTRDVIGQAKGVLMERHQIGADAAFAMLVELSQHQNRKLRDIAAEIAEGTEQG